MVGDQREHQGWRKAWHVIRTPLVVGLLVLTAVVLAIIAVVQAVTIRQTYPATDWGSVGEAMGALMAFIAAAGTLAAVWVAVLGWRQDVKQHRAEDADRADQRHRAQADLVGAWVCELSHDRAQVMVGLINASSGLLYDLEVHVDLETEIAQVPAARKLPNVPIGPYPTRAYVAVVPPGQWSISFRTTGTEDPLVATVLDVYFRDQQQQGWIRDIRGFLRPVERPLFDVPKISETLARELDPHRIIKSDYIMVDTPPLRPFDPAAKKPRPGRFRWRP